MYIPKFSQMIYNKLLFNALNKMKMYIKMHHGDGDFDMFFVYQ